MLAATRLTWRMQRWELAILIGAPLLLAAAMAFVAWQAGVTTAAIPSCTAGASSYAELSPGCRSLVDWGNLLGAVQATLVGIGTVAPFLVGLLLGAPLLAREIEKRTAAMAWSLSASRRRWLAGRVLPVVVLVVLALLIVGQASDALQTAYHPEGRGFADYGSRGPLVAARGLAVFGIGVVVGLVTGRVLPAILLTGLVAVAVFGGIEYGRGQLMRAEATWIDPSTNQEAIFMVYDVRWRDDATGALYTDQQIFENYPEIFGPQGTGIPPGMSQLYLTTPPDRYPSFAAWESGVLIGVALVAGLVATQLITSRRPD